MNKHVKILTSLLGSLISFSSVSSTYVLRVDIPGIRSVANDVDAVDTSEVALPDIIEEEELLISDSCYSVYLSGGNVGDGVYALNSGQYYCDMTNGGWTLLFNQNYDLGFYVESTSLSHNINSPSPGYINYSSLINTGIFRRDDKFEFKLEWPKERSYYNHWTQTTNPTIDQSVAGYTPILIGVDANYWGGLERNCELSCSSSFMDGSVGHSYWHYAIASYRVWANGIPAGISFDSVSQTLLWVK